MVRDLMPEPSHDDAPMIQMVVKEASALVNDVDFRDKCRYHGVPPHWVVACAEGLNPGACTRMGPLVSIDLVKLTDSLEGVASDNDRPEAILIGLVDQAMALGCSALALPYHSPMTRIRHEVAAPRPDDQAVILLCCRLIESVAEHDVGILPDDLFRNGTNARRLLVAITFTSSCVHAYLSSTTQDRDTRTNATMVRNLTAGVLEGLAGDQALPVARQGYLPHVRALWNHLLRTDSGLMADAVKYMRLIDLHARRHEPDIIRAVAARLRVLMDMTLRDLTEAWAKIPFMPVDME